MKIHSLFSCSIALLALASSSAGATFSFGGSGGEAGFYGNNYTFGPVSGVSVTATAFGYSSSIFQTAGVSQWSGGLGVSNRSEGLSPGSPNHSVDSSGSTKDYLLLTFTQSVVLSQVSFGWVGRRNSSSTRDSDFKYWIGDNLTTASLSSGGTLVDGGSSAASYGISGEGNTLWIAASQFNNGYDYFKVSGVTFTKNTPDAGSSLIFLGLGLLGLVGLKRRMAA